MVNDGKIKPLSATTQMEINRDNVRALIEKHRTEIRRAVDAGGNVLQLAHDQSDELAAFLRGRPAQEIERFMALHKEENEAVKQAQLAQMPGTFTPSTQHYTSQIADQSFHVRKKQLENQKRDSIAKAWASFISIFLAIAVIYSMLKK